MPFFKAIRNIPTVFSTSKYPDTARGSLHDADLAGLKQAFLVDVDFLQ